MDIKDIEIISGEGTDEGYEKGKADTLKVIEDIRAEIEEMISKGLSSGEYGNDAVRIITEVHYIIDKHMGVGDNNE